jgi:hypothetical protein
MSSWEAQSANGAIKLEAWDWKWPRTLPAQASGLIAPLAD